MNNSALLLLCVFRVNRGDKLLCFYTISGFQFEVHNLCFGWTRSKGSTLTSWLQCFHHFSFPCRRDRYLWIPWSYTLYTAQRWHRDLHCRIKYPGKLVRLQNASFSSMFYMFMYRMSSLGLNPLNDFLML